MLEDRARVGCNELIKIDLLVSSALGVTPDINRIALVLKTSKKMVSLM